MLTCFKDSSILQPIANIRAGTGWDGPGRAGAGRVGTSRGKTGRAGAGRVGTGRGGTGRDGPGRAGADRDRPGRPGRVYSSPLPGQPTWRETRPAWLPEPHVSAWAQYYSKDMKKDSESLKLTSMRTAWQQNMVAFLFYYYTFGYVCFIVCLCL